MPTKPIVKKLTGNSINILNAIRNGATEDYRNYVPTALNDGTNLREIGAVLTEFPNLKNEFVNSLVNRIGKVILTSKLYDNPIAFLKKGFLEYGETIEEIFVALAEPHTYDMEVAENEVFKREIADVRTQFHTLNYQKFYKATITEQNIKLAFLSMDGVTNLIAGIVDALYTSAHYDEFLTMKYLIAVALNKGFIKVANIPTVTNENMKTVTAQIKGLSNNLTFESTSYNLAGVPTYTDKSNQYLLVNSVFDAIMDVEVLASAFNMGKAEFLGHKVLIDSFGNLDIPRLNKLFKNDPNYYEFSQDELDVLNNIPAIVLDENWFMIFDNLDEFTENYNGQGLYWNYFYHVWKTFSFSMFSNAVAFVEGTSAVNSVTVVPSAVTVSIGQSVQLSANVETVNFAPRSVNWKSDTEGVTITPSGLVIIDNQDELKGKSVVITATSTYDVSKKGTSTLTIAND